jgi:predicted DNA-binding transcriptional regulator YafY
MAEKKQKRTDAERRVRQAERLSRLLRVLRCIMGPGRWDADGLSHELECSPRTVHRIMQTLSMSGVPWYYCKESECYRVRPGFRFPGLAVSSPTEKPTAGPEAVNALAEAKRLMSEGERFIQSLKRFCQSLERAADHEEPA